MQPARISSLKNPQIKKVLHLRDRRDRDESGLTVIEGLRELARAVENGVMIEQLFVCPEILSERHQGKLPPIQKWGPVLEVSKEILVKISYGERAEGVLAIGRPRVRGLEDINVKLNSLFILVEKIEKPGNLGAIIRTADAAGVDAVIVCDRTTDIYNPNVIRASLGSVFGVRVVACANPSALKFLKEHKAKIYAATPDAKASYSRVDYQGTVAIVLGSEDKGLSDFWLQESQMRIKIPMFGQVDSLNVSTTAAILIYEAIRQRSQ